ncbi:MAG: Glycosyl transferase family 2 [candidate division WS6 bacterium GW2011_GWA2_37_6]|uniref:Glycosyl transferase family 2 n=1 Tax=candidate division WS6 bacterium GW2011_GWA2_37_6 TaxID=1619087 RepID=A0A0G0GW30_9BACT|nr:MAG: Glycosyl transferase family 2 [candidate division WS6 bacterium GW2011_GWA2_37_6]
MFLNPDTIVYKKTLSQCVQYLTLHERVGAMTCKIVLPDGRLDKDARRSFPTPWIALTHFLGLDRVFPESRIFGKYWYGYVDENKFLEVDALQGAFFMARRKVLDKVGWFTEDYFLDGEDIDLSWKIRHLGYKLIYYPSVKIMHIKKVAKKNLEKIARVKYVNNGVNSMETFYRKRMWKEYPLILNLLVVFGIRVIKVIRFMIILIK